MSPNRIPPEPDEIRRARNLARAAHSNQRGSTGRLQITHVREVAEAAAAAGLHSTMIAAAWLHDVVEDTTETLEGLMGAFPLPTVMAVEYMTDVFTPGAVPGWNRARRKRAEADRLGTGVAPLQTLKLCDMWSNSRDILALESSFVPTYIQEMNYLLARLQAGNRELWQEVRDLIDSAAASLDLTLPDHTLTLPAGLEPGDRVEIVGR